jgi:WD40 repeat protein
MPAVNLDETDPSGLPAETDSMINTLIAIESGTGRVLQRLPYSPVYGMAVSPDGKMLAFGGHTEDLSACNCFFVLDTETGAELWRSETEVGFRGRIAWSPDGILVAAGDTNDGRTTVWESGTGAVKWIFDGYDPCFSADSRFLLVSAAPAFGRNLLDTGKGSVVYDVQSGIAAARLPGNGIFSPDGNTVLMQGAIWRASPLETLIGDAREQLGGRELTETERKRFYLE